MAKDIKKAKIDKSDQKPQLNEADVNEIWPDEPHHPESIGVSLAPAEPLNAWLSPTFP